MKQSIQMASLFALISLLTACQTEDPQDEQSLDKTAETVETVQLLPASDGDLMVNQLEATMLAPINGSHNEVNYTGAITNDAIVSAPSLSQQSSSDQYWRTVSGAELNKGINLAISQSDSIIRIAPRGDNSSGGLLHSPAIAPDKLRLYRVNKQSIDKSISLIQSISDPQAMATAGLVDDSSALRLSKQATAGHYQLQVIQPLAANDTYLINVKEKGSPYRLKLSSDAVVASVDRQLKFKLELSNSDNTLMPVARLKQENGQSHRLELLQVDQRWQAKLPEHLALPSSNRGLSEIQVNIETRVDNKPVIRTVKTAFKHYVPSAKLGQEATIHWQDHKPLKAVLALEVANPGRYSVSAILQGTATDGQQGNILQTASALWLDHDGKITLNFDRALIDESPFAAPYTLKALELKDQGQMARLSYLTTAAKL